MSAIILYPILGASLFYLGSRAVITRWFWSRYPPALARFMDCAACSGAWYGALLAITLGRAYEIDFLMFGAEDGLTPGIVALCAIVWTPIIASYMQNSLDNLGSAVSTTEDE